MSAPAFRLRLPLLVMTVGISVALAGIGLLKLIHLISNRSFHSAVHDACELARRISGAGSPWNRARLFPIVSGSGILLGVISRADVLESIRTSAAATVLEAGSESPVTIHPEDSLAAADPMVLRGIGRLPVIDHSDPPLLLGIISRRETLAARQQRLDDELR